MHKIIRLGAVAAALTLAVSVTTACDALLGAAGKLADLSGDFSGTVKDPDAKGLSGATIKVYKNSEIASVTKDAGSGNFIVDLEKLAQNTPSIPQTTSGADGTWKVSGLKIADGPYVIVAVNKRGSDFRGIDRDSRKLFSFQFTSPDKLPEFSANSAVFPNPTKPTSVDFTLPNETPPTPPPPAAVDPTPAPVAGAPTPPPAPAAGSPDELANKSNLPPPAPTNPFSNSLVAVKLTGIDPGTPVAGAANEFKQYKFKKTELENFTISSKVLIKASATGVTSATLRISHLNKKQNDAATITEVPVSFVGGKLVSDSPDGYLFAVPRDGSKTMLQLKDPSGAVSNAIALDASDMSDANVRPITIILTWDQGDGTDIDLHTFDVDKGDESWFGELSLPNSKGSLDLDNTEGYGPETFTGKVGKYGVSVNYWFGTKNATARVRVITADDDKSYLKTLRTIGEVWDVGQFITN